MKAITTVLRAHLRAGGPFIMHDLYTITLVSGEVLRLADFDKDLTHPVSGYVYASSKEVIKRGRTRIVIGVEVDTLDVSIFPRPTDTVGGLPFLAAARAGAFDGARLRLERAFLASDLSVIGTVIQFTGRFADVTLGRTEMQVRINSDVEALNIELPLNTFKPGCVHQLFNAGCGLDPANWGIGGSIHSGTTVSLLKCSLSNAAGWFNRGKIRFISGNLVGLSRTVKSYTPGNVALFLPLPALPAAGDLFVATPGCDRLKGTCSGKFNNLPQFRGCPYIPVAETAL